jgi:release factor glutamine methyltransferase
MQVKDALRDLHPDIRPQDAEDALLWVLHKPRAFLRTWPDHLLTEAQATQYQQALSRLANGEPVAYITGEQAFWTLLLQVTPDTLIPRPDTERLVELALDQWRRMPQAQRILDLGTGSGAIALSLAKECPQAQVVATDFSPAALAVAQANLLKNSLSNCVFKHGSWYAALADDTNQRFDLIVSNPPYINPTDPHLPDLTHEPITALTAPEQGLADLRQIIVGAPDYLQPNGWLLVEHGYDQGQAVRALFAAAGFEGVQTVQDYGGNDRVTLAKI